ncbi:putative cyclase-domain-containing protein [Hyaloraphidium curvatum]|nr:putative cyclase-domain-containing protein [Hyaloraphidium curvatum]
MERGGRAPLPTEAEIVDYFSKYSNWNRWGPDDVAGTLNHITEKHVLDAVKLVQEGRTVSLSWDVNFNAMTKDTNPGAGIPMRHMQATGGDRGTGAGLPASAFVDKDGNPTAERDKAVATQPHATSTGPRGSGAGEWISFTFHGYTFTHLDSLAHMFWDGRTYNGYDAAATVNLARGAELLDVVAAGRGGGIVGRGVLLDAASFGIGSGGSGELDPATGIPHRWMEPGEFVTGEDLEAIEKEQGVQVRNGDLIFLRTGYGLKKRLHGPDDTGAVGRAGWHPSCIPLFHARSVALISADTAQDAHPHAYPSFRSPVHSVGIVAMGLWLLDNADLEELAKECKARGRWEFMCSVQPCRFKGVTGSPVNPVAIF